MFVHRIHVSKSMNLTRDNSLWHCDWIAHIHKLHTRLISRTARTYYKFITIASANENMRKKCWCVDVFIWLFSTNWWIDWNREKKDNTEEICSTKYLPEVYEIVAFTRRQINPMDSAITTTTMDDDDDVDNTRIIKKYKLWCKLKRTQCVCAWVYQLRSYDTNSLFFVYIFIIKMSIHCNLFARFDANAHIECALLSVSFNEGKLHI